MESMYNLVKFAKTLKRGSLVGCAKGNKDDCGKYTIRVIYDKDGYRTMEDMSVKVNYDGSVTVLETELISSYKGRVEKVA